MRSACRLETEDEVAILKVLIEQIRAGIEENLPGASAIFTRDRSDR
jgi:hypothetical protein